MTASLSGVQATLMSVAGSLVIMILVWRLLSAWPARRYSEIVTEIVVAVVVSYFVFSPAAALGQLQAAGHSVFG